VKRYLLIILAASLSFRAAAGDARFAFFQYEGKRQERAIAQPAVGQFINPIVSGYAPDPSIVRVGDDYYLVNSTFAHFPGLPIYHSKDLVSWTQIGNAIERPSQLDFSGLKISRGAFAPDISFHDGTFYLVNTCVDCGGNFVITAKNPAGPWSDPVWLGFDGIDPSIFWDDDGKAYLSNNGPPNETPRYDGHRAIWMQEFEPKTLKLVGPRAQIVNGGVDIAKQPIWIEGPHIFKKDGTYYLIAAEGGTGDQHSEVVFRSRSVNGPFTPFAGNPILTQRDLSPSRLHPVSSAGHAKFVQTQVGEWWAVFLGVRPYGPDQYNIGRETFLLPVTWRDGWPVILEHGRPVPFIAKKPGLPSQPKPAVPTSGDFAYTEAFDGRKLPLAWIGVRTPKSELYALERGELVLKAGGSMGDTQSTPAFVGRRQQHHIATYTTAITYRPDHDEDRAGLVAVADDNAFLFFGIARRASQTVITLTARATAADSRDGRTIATTPIRLSAQTPVYLKISFNGGTYDAAYALREGQWISLLTNQDARFLDSHRAGGFVGTVVGPYNSGRAL